MDEIEENRGLIQSSLETRENHDLTTDIILGTVNKHNSKLLAFNRIFKSHCYMSKSTEISTFISPDYVFYLASNDTSPLFLLLCARSVPPP